MADAENVLPASKKRAAGRELSRDNPGLDDEEDALEQDAGTFKRASDEVLAGRRIVKVRRQQSTSAPSSNPFAGIHLVPPTESSAAPVGKKDEALTAEKSVSVDVDGKDNASKDGEQEIDDNNKQSESKIDEPETKANADAEKATDKETSGTVNNATAPEADNEKAAGSDETEDKKDNDTENKDSSAEATHLSSFQQLSSSRNAFTGLAGSGFSSSTFLFGSISKDGFASGGTSGPPLSSKSEESSAYSSLGFGLSNNGNSSLFGTSVVSIASKSGSSYPSMQEVPIETGEENEEAVFQADSVLFEFIDGGWKERGKGELKVNVSTCGTERARLVMRARGNYRLILNASLYPDMKLTDMDKKGITFACMNSTGEGNDSLSTFALKFKDVSIVEEFRGAVTAHKGKTSTVLKTPENSPKATDD